MCISWLGIVSRCLFLTVTMEKIIQNKYRRKKVKKALDKRFDLLFTSFVFRQTNIPIGLVTLTPGKPDFYWSETCEPLIPWGTRLPSVLLDSKQCVKIVKKTWRWSMGRCRHAKSFICEYNSGKETLSPT